MKELTKAQIEKRIESLDKVEGWINKTEARREQNVSYMCDIYAILRAVNFVEGDIDKLLEHEESKRLLVSKLIKLEDITKLMAEENKVSEMSDYEKAQHRFDKFIVATKRALEEGGIKFCHGYDGYVTLIDSETGFEREINIEEFENY